MRASRELPPLPDPLSAPSSSQMERREPVVDSVDLEGDDPVAPGDINLEFDARNIITGKWRCTQSSRVADPNAAYARPTKKGSLTSK